MEYKFVEDSSPYMLQDKINKLTTGLDGWEVVTIFPIVYSQHNNGTIVAVLSRAGEYE